MVRAEPWGRWLAAISTAAPLVFVACLVVNEVQSTGAFALRSVELSALWLLAEFAPASRRHDPGDGAAGGVSAKRSPRLSGLVGHFRRASATRSLLGSRWRREQAKRLSAMDAVAAKPPFIKGEHLVDARLFSSHDKQGVNPIHWDVSILVDQLERPTEPH